MRHARAAKAILRPFYKLWPRAAHVGNRWARELAPGSGGENMEKSCSGLLAPSASNIRRNSSTAQNCEFSSETAVPSGYTLRLFHML